MAEVDSASKEVTKAVCSRPESKRTRAGEPTKGRRRSVFLFPSFSAQKGGLKKRHTHVIRDNGYVSFESALVGVLGESEAGVLF